jgi:hypothetical protein
MSMHTNPFEILGLPVRRDLTDEQVDAAWRKIAVATHPDRPDGGDLARYTQASAAFAELRVPWSRSEAYADVVEQARTQGYDGFDDDGQPLHRAAAPRPVRSRDRHPPRRPRHSADPAAVPHQPRPPVAPGPPRDHRRRAVSHSAAADPRQPGCTRRHPRADHLVRADRPQGPGTTARTLRDETRVPSPPGRPAAWMPCGCGSFGVSMPRWHLVSHVSPAAQASRAWAGCRPPGTGTMWHRPGRIPHRVFPAAARQS